MNRFFPRKLSQLSLTRAVQTSPFEWIDHAVGIEKAVTPPVSWYTENLFYKEVEVKHVFNTWLNVGRVEPLKNVGDFFATTILDQPIVIVRSNDGKIRAFYNVCRHHAAQLCDDGTGSVGENGRFTCPYHGWQYNTEGRLTKAVKMKGCQNFHPKEFGLHELPLNIVGPWVYIKLLPIQTLNKLKGSPPPNIYDDLPDAKEMFGMLENTHFASMQFIRSRSYDIKCNWKVFIDNYLDGGYHVPYAHPGLTTHLNLADYQRKGFLNFHLQSCPSKATTQDSTSSPEDAAIANTRLTAGSDQLRDALYIYQYPNICINRYGQWMDTNIVWPLDAHTCRVVIDWYVEKDLLAHEKAGQVIEKCLEDSDQVQQEDVWLCERVSKGLRSAGYDVGRYAPTLEGKKSTHYLHMMEDI
jgi:choline monooxygenase